MKIKLEKYDKVNGMSYNKLDAMGKEYELKVVFDSIVLAVKVSGEVLAECKRQLALHDNGEEVELSV